MKLGDYFKAKEQTSALTLDKQGWFIIRLDGKAFSTYTGKLQKPFDTILSEAMVGTCKALSAEIQNVKMCYTQSDEISLVLSDLDTPLTSLFFDGKVQKIVSVASSICTAHFNRLYKHPEGKLALFDARVFRLDSEKEVKDYLLWRQRDAIKNALTLISLKHYSHKQLDKKHSGDKLEMIKQKGDDVSNYHPALIRGFIFTKETRKVPFQNPKTKEHGFAERSFWVEKDAPEFDKISTLASYYKMATPK